jgi:hypothetical protein
VGKLKAREAFENETVQEVIYRAGALGEMPQVFVLAPRSGARSLAGVEREAAHPGTESRASQPFGLRELAMTLTGGIARCARSTPR